MRIGAISFCAVLTVLLGLIASCQSEDEIEFKRYYTAGAEIYQARCQNCHGVSGEGLSSLIPPLTDSVYLKNNLHRLSCLIRAGAENPMTVNGKAYQGKMPAADLSPIELAKLLTYIGNSFGNKLKTIPVQQTTTDVSGCN